MNLPEELKFKSEDEKLAMIEKYEAEGGSNPDDVTRIMDAPVEGGEPREEPVAESVDTPEEPVETPQETPAIQKKETTSDEPRNWTITEDDIPKDEYFDKKEGRNRKFITHKNPKDLFKTVINEQKRIHYLEDVLLPQATKEAEERAKAQYEQQMADIRKELESLKASKQALPPQKPAGEPAETGNLQQTGGDLESAINELKGIDPDSTIEHTDKLHKALTAALEHITNQSKTIQSIQQQNQQVAGKFTQFETSQQQRAEQEKLAQQQRESEQNWQRACQMVDTFATTNPDFKAEFGNVTQTFSDMSRDAENFHAQLAGLRFQKSPNATTAQERMEAAQLYMSGDQGIVQAATQYGFEEPTNYRAWAELDQVDAMRTGLYRDPVSKKWINMVDPVTRKPVHLGDMQTAYGRYLDVSGKRQQRINQKLNQERESFSNAVSRRDNGLVSMDTNRLRGDGSGRDMSDEQAAQVLEQVDTEAAMADYMRTGNKEQLELINRALKIAGHSELEIPELAYQTVKR